MMVGFKTGPRNWEEGQSIVVENGAKLCEVWFRIDKAQEYTEMLQWLRDHHVATGLHHWGLIDGMYKTNITAANPAFRQQTIQQIKDTIDVAAQFSCVYVNAHSGAAATEKISFDPTAQELVKGETLTKEEHTTAFLHVTDELHTYANKKGVLLTIETLTGMETLGEESRLEFYDAGNTHYTNLLEMGRRGGFIANDIVHTASQMMVDGLKGEQLWEALYEFTKQAAPFTRLIHINTVPPPFNGTDSHHGTLEEDFALGVFPSKEQILQLLSLFKGREDVYLIPEPRHKMRENFLVLQEFSRQI